eukprot:1144241-Pelagomonas_calceolata.AAC.2
MGGGLGCVWCKRGGGRMRKGRWVLGCVRPSRGGQAVTEWTAVWASAATAAAIWTAAATCTAADPCAAAAAAAAAAAGKTRSATDWMTVQVACAAVRTAARGSVIGPCACMCWPSRDAMKSLLCKGLETRGVHTNCQCVQQAEVGTVLGAAKYTAVTVTSTECLTPCRMQLSTV